MTLEVIYVTRHGFRSNWLVNPSTGDYTATIRSPTGIAADPALTAHGVDQARELGRHLVGLSPPVERVYSSPYYRCLQTVEPFVRAVQVQVQVHQVQGGAGAGSRSGSGSGRTEEEVEAQQKQQASNSIAEAGPSPALAPSTAKPDVVAHPTTLPQPPQTVGHHHQSHSRSSISSSSGSSHSSIEIRLEPGLGEWYGAAPFEHPSPAPRQVLAGLFPGGGDGLPPLLDPSYPPAVVPTQRGESIAQLHDRVALTVGRIVDRCDAEGVRAVLLCSHAAVVIALGRALTGWMPEDVEVEDFRAFTCGLSVYRRRKGGRTSSSGGGGGGRHGGHSGHSGGLGRGVGGEGGGPGEEEEEEDTAAASAAASAAALMSSTSTESVQPSSALLRQGHLPSALLGSAANNTADHDKVAASLGGDFTGDHHHHHHRQQKQQPQPLLLSEEERENAFPRELWRDGRGVRGGWDCEMNSDCSFLNGGEERGWRFSGDESFTSKDNNSQDDAGVCLGVVIEGRKTPLPPPSQRQSGVKKDNPHL